MANWSDRDIETAIKVTFTRLGYLVVNPDITYTCHITTGEATRSADKYGQNSDNPQSLSKSWTTNGCFGTAGCPLSVVAALGKPISVHSATFSVM